MRLLNPASSLFLMAFAILIFTSSLRLGMGDHQNPGPGFLPTLASALLFLLSLTIFVKDLRLPSTRNQSGQEEQSGILFDWKRSKTPMILAVTLAIYFLVLERLGFLISTFLLMFVMMLTYESKKWYRDLLIAALFAAMSFLLFDTLLEVRLPPGVFHI